MSRSILFLQLSEPVHWEKPILNVFSFFASEQPEKNKAYNKIRVLARVRGSLHRFICGNLLGKVRFLIFYVLYYCAKCIHFCTRIALAKEIEKGLEISVGSATNGRKSVDLLYSNVRINKLIDVGFPLSSDISMKAISIKAVSEHFRV